MISTLSAVALLAYWQILGSAIRRDEGFVGYPPSVFVIAARRSAQFVVQLEAVFASFCTAMDTAARDLERFTRTFR